MPTKDGKASTFDVFEKMSERNLDIAVAVDLLNFQRQVKKKGGIVTIGVADPQFDYLINQAGTGIETHYALFYIVNKKQYHEIESEINRGLGHES